MNIIYNYILCYMQLITYNFLDKIFILYLHNKNNTINFHV